MENAKDFDILPDSAIADAVTAYPIQQDFWGKRVWLASAKHGLICQLLKGMVK